MLVLKSLIDKVDDSWKTCMNKPQGHILTFCDMLCPKVNLLICIKIFSEPGYYVHKKYSLFPVQKF